MTNFLVKWYGTLGKTGLESGPLVCLTTILPPYRWHLKDSSVYVFVKMSRVAFNMKLIKNFFYSKYVSLKGWLVLNITSVPIESILNGKYWSSKSTSSSHPCLKPTVFFTFSFLKIMNLLWACFAQGEQIGILFLEGQYCNNLYRGPIERVVREKTSAWRDLNPQWLFFSVTSRWSNNSPPPHLKVVRNLQHL